MLIPYIIICMMSLPYISKLYSRKLWHILKENLWLLLMFALGWCCGGALSQFDLHFQFCFVNNIDIHVILNSPARIVLSPEFPTLLSMYKVTGGEMRKFQFNRWNVFSCKSDSGNSRPWSVSKSFQFHHYDVISKSQITLLWHHISLV